MSVSGYVPVSVPLAGTKHIWATDYGGSVANALEAPQVLLAEVELANELAVEAVEHSQGVQLGETGRKSYVGRGTRNERVDRWREL